ncbi:MAG: hypothetical protein ABWY06_02635 [Pseudomonas sp.]|uniref:hypothetical protein n=1 Tax=Pseudomonas sp. TaxID=306 RepID=UPI003397AB7E
MTVSKSVNGYNVQQLADGGWWICTPDGESVAGPFGTLEQACEVAAVLQDQPAAPRRRPS